MKRRAAVAVAAWAKERVPLYRDLYAGAPIAAWQDFCRLPVLTSARLQGTPLAEQVDDIRDVVRTFTPLRLQSAVLPAAMVTDHDDTDAIYEWYRDGLEAVGVRTGTRLVILTPPEQRYFAAEAADVLGFFGVPAHVVIVADRAAWPESLAALAPEAVLDLRPNPSRRRTGMGRPGSASAPCLSALPHERTVTVRALESPGPDLYIVPEAGIVAVRPAGEPAYVPLERYVLIESARDGTLLLTALRRYHQPLIRYELPERGRVERRRLYLDEAAP